MLKQSPFDNKQQMMTTLWSRYRKAIDDVGAGVFQQAAQTIIGLFTSVLVARGLGPSGLGMLTLVLSVSSFAGSLTDMGLGNAAVRYGARSLASGDVDNANKIFRWTLRMRLFLVFVVSTVIFLLAPILANDIWDNSELTPLIRLSLILGAVAAFSAFSQYYFQAHKRFRLSAVVVAGKRIIELGGLLVIVLISVWTPYSVLFVKIITASIGAIAFLSIIPRNAMFSLEDFHNKNIRGWLSSFFRQPKVDTVDSNAVAISSIGTFTTYLMISSLFVMIFMNLDTWFLGAYWSSEEVGIYGVALRFQLPLVAFANAFNAALWPRVANLTKFAELAVFLRKTMGISLILAIVCTIYAFSGPLLAGIVFGDEYATSVRPAQILCLTYCIAILVNPIGVIGHGLNLTSFFALVNLVQLLSAIPLFLILVPAYGATGAALGILVVNILGAGLNGTKIIMQMFRSTRN